VSLRESSDTGSPLGQAVFTIIAAIAQLERSLIAERVRAGLRRAKADARRLGRPRVEVNPARLESVIHRGLSVRDGARELGISPSSFARLARSRFAGDNGSTSQAAF
jgi:DNA invertase Pin-like site-specific DNA recombinase